MTPEVRGALDGGAGAGAGMGQDRARLASGGRPGSGEGEDTGEAVPWLSDAAIARGVEIDRKRAAGERVLLTDLIGLLEPRVKPTDAERCVCCGLDARDEVGGQRVPGGRMCGLCLDRGHDEDDHDD